MMKVRTLLTQDLAKSFCIFLVSPIMSSRMIFFNILKLIFFISLMSTALTTRVAVVTGANRGIGYAIVKGLCEKFNGDVYLTARNEKRGLAAVKSLNEVGYYPKFHLLDITIPESVEKLRDYMMEHYGGVDVLVNNAAIAFLPNKTTEPFSFQAEETLHVNYFAFRDLCRILFPILKSHARVVNLSSVGGHLSQIPGEHLRDILASPDLTEERLSTLMTSFVEEAKNLTDVKSGWPHWPYGVSKVGVSALTRIQQRELSNDTSRTDVVVNHVHPGYVDTELNDRTGPLTIEQGAEAPVYLALLPENCTSPKGDFVWKTKQIVDWVKGPLPSKD